MDPQQPVTVSISRKVIEGHEAEYEAWLHTVIELAAGFPGSQGASVLTPSPQTGGRYVVIYRFDTWEHADRWETSRVRESWVRKLEGITEGEAQFRRQTGLEFWFQLSDAPEQAPPPRHKMTVVLIVLVCLLGLAINAVLDALAPQIIGWKRVLVVALFQVLLLTYVIMPPVTKALRGWLFR
ncbi:MAG: hypothetical protein MRY63_09945 [Neomegalonema sp.]|nr:hypothetical protein [Neomegalonema sp.]